MLVRKDGIVFSNELIEQDRALAINNLGQVKANSLNEVGIVRDLIAYYPLDKDINDYSCNNNHLSGTYIGTEDNAVEIKSALVSHFTFGDSGTISACGKYSTTANSQMLFSFNTDTYRGPDLYFAHDVISWNKGDGGANAFKKNGVSQGYPSINEWHHYVVVISKELNKVTLYIDGEYCGDANYLSPAQSNTKNFVIGAYDNLVYYLWNGEIANFKVSTSCWTEKEVLMEYKTTKNKVFIDKEKTFFAKCFNEKQI